MKLLTFIVFLTIILASNASIASEQLSFKAKQAQRIIEGDQALREKWIEKSTSKRFLKSAIKAVRELEESNYLADVAPAEALLIEMLGQKYNLGNRWKSHNNFIENPVWINNSIIDMDRLEIGTVEFRQVQAENTIQYDLSRGLIINGQRLSSGRMADGLAPIGPDGKPILLCRIIETERASFYEIAQSELQNFLKMTQSRMQYQDSCLNYKNALSKYWKARLKTLYDNNNVPITYENNQ